MTPIAGASPQSFISQWQTSRQIRDPRFYSGLGFGYGADMNGLAEESQPTSGHPIAYPFKSYDGAVTFTREQWGQRVFDLNRDGVANYGMFPDWMQELQTLAGRELFPEFLTDRDESEAVAGHLRRWVEDPAAHDDLRRQLAELRGRVAVPGACERAARFVVSHLTRPDAADARRVA